MKYSEFKAEVEKLDWCVTGNEYEVHVLNYGGGKLMVIDKTDTHVLDPDHISYVSLTHEDKSVLLDLSVKLAKTPLAEREEEKKYQFKLSLPIGIESGIYGWLNQNTYTAEFKLSSIENTAEMKTIFTELEASQMDITGFEKIEVLE